MAGEVHTIALKAGVESKTLYPVPAGAAVRMITASASTAKVEVSYDGGLTFHGGAFGTQAASKTYEQRFPVDVVVRGTAVTGTATLEIDEPAALPLMFIKGTPLNIVTAAVGTVAIRYDGGADTIVYVKETEAEPGTADATGWVPLINAP